MEQIVSENIFLLEFVVDKCIILPCAIPNEIQDIIGETCVSFKFFDNEPLNICEEDFAPKRTYGAENEHMKSGKSCLFAMSSMQATTALTEFDILVGVFKKLMIADEIPDSKVMIGMATIPIDETFTEVIDVVKMNKEDNIKETVARSLKNVYNVVNTKDNIIGSIEIFLRLSCFGKIIVTQFQMNLEEKSVFFSDKDGKSLFKYRKSKKEEIKSDIETEEVDDEALNCVPRQPTCTPVNSTVEVAPIPEFDGRCIGCNPVLIHNEAPTYPCPDDKDVFILRIGKKGDCEGKRAKMELVLVTPKGLGKKYVNKLDDETEFNAQDCPGGKFSKIKKDKSKKKDKKKKEINEEVNEVKEIKEPPKEEKKTEVKENKERKPIKEEKKQKEVVKEVKEVKKDESNKNKDKDKQTDQKKKEIEKYTIKFDTDTNKDKKKDIKPEKEMKNVENFKNNDKEKQKDKKKDVKDNDRDKNKNKEKENKNTLPSYANVIVMKADKETKKDNECCLPPWCQCYMPTLPQSITWTSITCVAYDDKQCCPQQAPSSCYMSWDTPSSITLKCSKGKIRRAICC